MMRQPEAIAGDQSDLVTGNGACPATAGEAAHRLAVGCLACGIAPRRDASPDAGLVTTFAGMQLPNPLGLAAGFDKNAEAMAGAHRIGFGFVEVGDNHAFAATGQ